MFGKGPEQTRQARRDPSVPMTIKSEIAVSHRDISNGVVSTTRLFNGEKPKLLVCRAVKHSSREGQYEQIQSHTSKPMSRECWIHFLDLGSLLSRTRIAATSDDTLGRSPARR